jgi:hypothetical protein
MGTMPNPVRSLGHRAILCGQSLTDLNSKKNLFRDCKTVWFFFAMAKKSSFFEADKRPASLYEGQ